MRELTQEEVDLAPDWATHYAVDELDSVIYESLDLCWWDGLLNPMENYDLCDGAKPIPRKAFDISGFEFSDSRIKHDGTDLVVTYQQWVGHMSGYSDEEMDIKFNKDDAIAIAKALGVTGGDL